jgi:4-amino-4-deoxy-L-arabinose transferase-like glycosyltransferase
MDMCANVKQYFHHIQSHTGFWQLLYGEILKPASLATQSILSSLVAGYRRHFNWILLAIIFFGLILRISALLSFQNSLYSGFLVWDENVYHHWALDLLAGKAKDYIIPDFAPLPAYVMWLLYKLFAPAPIAFRVFNIIIATITCYVIYDIGRYLANRSIGLLSCFLASFYGPFIFFSFTLLKTSLAVFLFSLAVCQFLHNYKTASKALMFGAGISIGLLINVRPNMIFVLIFMPLALGWQWRKQRMYNKKIVLLLSLYILGLAVSMGPFILQQYKVTKEVAVTVTGGSNLYLANNLQNLYPYYRPVPFAVSVPSQQGTQFIIEASRQLGHKALPHEASSYFTLQVMKAVYEHPFAFAKKVAVKILALCNKYEAADNYDVQFMSEYIRLFKLPFFSFWIISPLAMIGLISRYRTSGRYRALAGILLAYSVTLIIFFTNVRIRMPLLVILIPLAACGIESTWQLIKEKRTKKLFSSTFVALVVLIIAFLPIPGTDDVTGHYNTHAINLKRIGKIKEAVVFWEKSSLMEKPYSAYANLSLAQFYFSGGRVELAKSYVDKIAPDSFAAAHKFELLGDIHLKQKAFGAAQDAYEKAKSINFGLLSVRRKLIDLYRKTNPQKVDLEREELSYISSFYN